MFKYVETPAFNENTSHGLLACRINKGESILEFGCAQGGFSAYVKENLGCSVVGIEISKEALDVARVHLDKAILADIEKYEWENEIAGEKFDVVMFADVLEHLKDPVRALKTASGYLKEGGRILFSIPNIAHADVIAKLLKNRFDYTETGLLDNTHIRFWGKENLLELCEKAGLFLQEITATYVRPGTTEQGITSDNVIENFISYQNRHDIYQFICVAYKSDFALANNIEYKCNISNEIFRGLKYYIDTGNGFCENSVVAVNELSDGYCSLNVKIPSDAVRIRVDLREDSGYSVRDFSSALDGKFIRPQEVYGAFKIGEIYLLVDNDSQFVFDCKGCSTFEFKASVCSYHADFKLNEIFNDIRVKIEESNNNILYLENRTYDLSKTLSEAEIKLSATEAKLSDSEQRLTDACSALESSNSEIILLNEANAALTSNFEECKSLYYAEIEKSNYLNSTLAHVQAMYDSISNAALWKITKPLRVVLDFIKRVIKKIPILRKLARGLKCLKQNGLKYTLHRIKDKLRHNKESKKQQYTDTEIQAQREEKFEKNIKFSILVPLYNTNEKYLIEMIESVRAQTYSNWELCLADGSDENHAYVEKAVRKISEVDPRVKYYRLEKNRGISENTNECAKMADGDYIALLDHDDLLANTALYENAKAIEETDADVLYSDEDHLSVGGMHVNPFYKPDFSPDLLKSQMYICHFTVIRRSLFESVGGFDSRFDGSQDYDLMLRLTEVTDQILHIPRVLYTWRECEGSTAANADAKPYAHDAGRKALDAHLKRKYGDLAYADDSDYTFVFDARFGGMEINPLVSIIIPMKDNWQLTENCVNSILEMSTYSNYEIILLDNRSEKKSTFEWFDRVKDKDSRIKVFKADMEFNWSKLNNYGISKSNGELYIFLNNDTLIITPDWIERLCENALRDDIGVVGPLLLYEDNTIQHAGVVIGFGGWADHVFKGMQPIHYGAPYVSPMVCRNVLAVTGACVAVSKKTIEKIGVFDESFIICGSDIELCVRAYQSGLYNKYMPTVKLYHLESKSRDSYIPEIDFKRSYECYEPYRENIDPFYNINLDLDSLIPREKVAPMNKINFKNFLKRCPVTAPICRAIKRAIMSPAEYNVPEVEPIKARKDTCDNGKLRVNLLIPSVDSKHVFGGIATALKFFESICQKLGCDSRIITCDAPVSEASAVVSKDYEIVKSENDLDAGMQLVSFNDRYCKTIPVRKNDIFMATGWWTAYTIKDVINWQSREFSIDAMPLIYMIQDYEPGFYPWSSRYMMAESTYKLSTPIYAVINSNELHEFLNNNGYKFEREWSFNPVLNDKLGEFLPKKSESVKKNKQILVYGRPTTERNAFALLMAALKLWREKYKDASEWQIISAGEVHDDVDLGEGMFVKSTGKLSLEEYAQTMLNTYAGISLMVSPHPSYPPLEMSTFGVKTITNCYANKDLSSVNSNIISLSSCSAQDIANALTEVCEGYSGEGITISDSAYARGGSPFGNCDEELANEIRAIF